MEKTLKQTKLMEWVKMEHTDFYSLFHKHLAAKFTFWNMKFDSNEYVWFCCLNESCQAGFLLEYINKYGIEATVIKDKCLDILMIKPLDIKNHHVLPDFENMTPEKRKEYENANY
jgi:hypothetical protein